MLKKMRWRFIGAAMTAFAAVILTLLGCVNIWNYWNVTTQLDNTVPHSFHYVNKNIRPDMRLLLPENVLRSSERYKCLKDKAVSSGCIFYQGIQFSV